MIEYGDMIDKSPAFMVSSPILDMEEFKKYIFKKPSKKRKVVEKKMKLELLDVAHVFHYNDMEQDIFFE